MPLKGISDNFIKKKKDQKVATFFKQRLYSASEMSMMAFHDCMLCRIRHVTGIFTFGKAVSQLEKYSIYSLLPNGTRKKPKLKSI